RGRPRRQPGGEGGGQETPRDERGRRENDGAGGQAPDGAPLDVEPGDLAAGAVAGDDREGERRAPVVGLGPLDERARQAPVALGPDEVVASLELGRLELA